MDKLAKQGIFSYHNNGDGYVGTCKKWDMIPEKVPVQGPEKERTVVGAVLSLFLATEKG